MNIHSLPPFAQLVKFLSIVLPSILFEKERKRERNFLISYFPRSRRKSETLVVQENWKPIRPPVYWFCKSSRNSESSGGGRGRRLTLAKAINKNTGARAPNTFRFRPSVGRASGSHPFLPALEVINPTEPRLRVFNFRATFLFMCTTYRNRFCRLKLLKSVEINEKPRQIDRNKGTSDDTTRHPRPFSPFLGTRFFLPSVYIRENDEGSLEEV